MAHPRPPARRFNLRLLKHAPDAARPRRPPTLVSPLGSVWTSINRNSQIAFATSVVLTSVI